MTPAIENSLSTAASLAPEVLSVRSVAHLTNIGLHRAEKPERGFLCYFLAL